MNNPTPPEDRGVGTYSNEYPGIFALHISELALITFFFIFCICYGLCYLAYILFSICLAIAFNLYSCLVFHSCGNTTSSKQNLERQHLKTVGFVMWQEQLPIASKLRNIKINFKSYVLWSFFLQISKCTTVEWRQLTFLPRPYGVHLNKFLLRADRFLVFQMYLGDIVTFKTLKPISFHSSILEHISSSLVRYPEVYFDQRWSERNENPPWKCLRQARHHVCHFVNVYCGLVPPLPPHIWTSNNCTTLWKNRT